MGQAFDENGAVLGEAFGATKREVFDKLMAEHADAAEVRIRSLRKRIDAVTAAEKGQPWQPPQETAGHSDGPSAEMPRYRCHKEVWALQIERIEYDNIRAYAEHRETDGSALLVFTDPAYAPRRVGRIWLQRHDPHVGGYLVVYDDGYQSFSPPKAFEDGYTRIP